MRVISHLLAPLILSAAFSLSAVEITTPAAVPEKLPDGRPFDVVFQERMKELCAFVRSNSPDGKIALSPELLRKIETELLKELIPGIVPEEEYHPAAIHEAPGKRQFSLRYLKNGTLLYLRIDRVQLFHAEKSLRFMEGKKTTSGIILDLRNCAEKDYASLDKAYRTIAGQGSPSAVLISPATAWAGEILAHRLNTEKQGILMGKRSADSPFAMKKTILHGYTLRVPVRPAGTEKLPAGPCIPAIHAETFPLPDLSVQRTEQELFQQDPLLRQAADLMTALGNLKMMKGNKK